MRTHRHREGNITYQGLGDGGLGEEWHRAEGLGRDSRINT